MGKIKLSSYVLMILTSVFGVANIGIGFFNMGYTAIPWFIIGGVFFFIPYSFMLVELATGFKEQKGGIYSWLEKSVSIKFAIIGIMIWYASYIIWMFNKSLVIWVPLSIALFGQDITQSIDSSILSILAILLVSFIGYLVTRGPEKFSIVSSIGGISVIILNILLIFGGFIVLCLNGFTFVEPINGIGTFVGQSPNPNFISTVAVLGFLVYAVFAYGGIEAIAGLSDKIKNPEKNISKGIIIAAIFIIIAYIMAFLMAGAVTSYSSLEGANSVNALYIIMYNLGYQLGGDLVGNIFMRFAGLGLFLSFIGAFTALSYAPLKQLIEGTPAVFWPKSFQKKNKNGVIKSAILVQSGIVIVFIILKMISTIVLVKTLGNDAGGDIVTNLFNSLISMANIGMTVPYLFIIYAYYKYRKNDNLNKEMIFFKKKWQVIIVTVITFTIVLFANIFSLLQPLIESETLMIGMGEIIWCIIGPLLFGIIGYVLYYRKRKEI